jgi:thiol-disulfide isomerase/thioredoxin
MRYGKRRTIFATLILFALIPSLAAHSQTVVETADQSLAAATKASLEGHYKEALANARKARASALGDLKFGVKFIVAVVEMADMSDQRHRNSLFNEALKAANELEVSKIADGTQDAEFSWHYMTAIGKLGDSLSESNPEIAAKILAAQSQVASNLKSNPGFPQESLPLLAEPMMSKAIAGAIRKDADATFAAMQVAFDAGFTSFEKLHENQFVKDLKSEKVDALIRNKFLAYQKQLKKWARESVANFNAFDFKFDVADIEAGRIRNSDFRGRILVLDLWATWCQPCREAIPHFVKLDEKFRERNVDVVGVSMDNPDDPRKSMKVVRNFVDDNGVEYVVAMGNRSMMNQLAPGQKLPTVLFINSEGKVRFIAEGPHNFHQLAAITNELINQEKNSPTSLFSFSEQH